MIDLRQMCEYAVNIGSDIGGVGGVFLCKHKTAYEMRISDWSSDVCSSDLSATAATRVLGTGTTGSRIANGSYAGHSELERRLAEFYGRRHEIGRASCRERVCQYV